MNRGPHAVIRNATKQVYIKSRREENRTVSLEELLAMYDNPRDHFFGAYDDKHIDEFRECIAQLNLDYEITLAQTTKIRELSDGELLDALFDTD
jgi:hypothetical protein